MTTQQICIAGGMRTPFGDYGKSLKNTRMIDLGIHAAKASVERAGIAPEKLDHSVWGNVLPVDHDGFYASRAIALGIGMREESCALNVSRACGSGTQAIITAAEQILSGHGKLALAGGGENFSRGPYMDTASRWGAIRGPKVMEDSLDWAYRDPFSRELMGETAENLSDDFQYTREQMDEYALMSQQRAGAAIESGFLGRQIAPIEVKEGKTTRLMEVDEFPRPTVTAEKLAKLKPVFREGGRVTPGNSSGVTDGAAMVVVGDRAALEAEGAAPRVILKDWAIVGVSPRIMGCGPVPAIRALLERNNMSLGDIDYFEINEAFAAVNLHTERELGIRRDNTNLYGGGISLGHPPGATGARMTLVAMEHLEETGGRYAVVSMCMGAGQGMAVLLENIGRA
ncbi:MAG: thiolase family protein [Marivibrio sp.]|uniref:thiolase family protein n=1 Tax=Marivibrio sp. TaxID=2039719 RepID=UPI0032EE3BD4